MADFHELPTDREGARGFLNLDCIVAVTFLPDATVEFMYIDGSTGKLSGEAAIALWLAIGRGAWSTEKGVYLRA